MKTTTVNVLGREMKVGFDFSVNLQYEEDHGKMLEITSMGEMNNQMRLVYSVLKAFNEGFRMSFQEFLHEMDVREFKMLAEIISTELMAFYRIPKVAEEHVPEAEPAEEGESPNQ